MLSRPITQRSRTRHAAEAPRRLVMLMLGALLALSSGANVSAQGTDYDTDNDSLIDVENLPS